LTRRTSTKYKKYGIRGKEQIDLFFRELKKLEEEIHRDQEIQENDEEDED
jgi:hypothetical protein